MTRSFKDAQEEIDAYQKKLRSLERRLEEVMEAKTGLEKENGELKGKVNRLTIETRHHTESFTSLEKKYKSELTKYEEEKESLLERLKGTENKFSQELVDLMTQKDKLEVERMNYFDCMTEIDDKQSRNKIYVYKSVANLYNRARE
jgi:chromosome segregation ATPase